MLAIIELQNDLEKMKFEIPGEAKEYVGGRNGGIWSLVSSSYEQAKREESSTDMGTDKSKGTET